MPRWFFYLAVGVVALTTLPAIVGWIKNAEGSIYLGVQWNLDDHAVYASWMKQAQEGRFFFENRFTTDEQPGLTVHLYFWVLGLLSKLTGIAVAMHIGRIVFSLLALYALYRLVSRLTSNDSVRALAMCVAVFGGGIGWLAWKRYGHEGPIDVWQPEAFVFPSLLTNGLFAVSLWLILTVFNKMLDARDSWKPVFSGALALLVLTNIHTYDTLLIALISAGWLVSCIVSRTATFAWVGRCFVIAAGALPALGWFLYVRSVDPVFLERAQTPTPAPAPMNLLLGILPMAVFAVIALVCSAAKETGTRWLPVGALIVLVAAHVYLSTSMRQDNPFATAPFVACFALALVVCATYSSQNPVWSLFFAWLAIGIVAPYYPAFFQRKLGMMIAVPYGVLAGVGLAMVATRLPSLSLRAFTSAVGCFLLSLTSVRWVQRELQMIEDDVSNTTVHRVYLDKDAAEILNIVRQKKTNRDVLLAHPGVPLRLGQDEYDVVISDLNPIMTGWAGVKTYASHWSETPDYVTKRTELTSTVYDVNSATPETIRNMVDKSGATFVIVPNREDLRPFVVSSDQFLQLPCEVLYRGDTYILLKLAK